MSISCDYHKFKKHFVGPKLPRRLARELASTPMPGNKPPRCDCGTKKEPR
jgi:hypothetical protein